MSKEDKARQNRLVTILFVITALLLIRMVFNGSPEEIDYDLLSDEIAEKVLIEMTEKENIDYDIIKAMIEESQLEQTELIKESIEASYNEIDKDFGVKFEEATSYFGGKIKETYDDISKEFKK